MIILASPVLITVNDSSSKQHLLLISDSWSDSAAAAAVLAMQILSHFLS